MKEIVLLLFFTLHCTQTISAQNEFSFIKIQPESIADTIAPNQLGFANADLAAEVDTQIIAELVYAPEDVNGNRFFCDTPSVDFTGKIVLIDRGEGACLFSDRALRAQQMGAVGVIFRNFENIVVTMGNTQDGVKADIPVLMIPFDMGIDLENALLNEDTVIVSFSPDLSLNTLTFQQNIGLNIYPNPMKNFSTFELKERNLVNGEIQLYDIMGRLVKKQTFSQNKFLLERNNLPSGSYFFKITLKSPLISTIGLLQIID